MSSPILHNGARRKEYGSGVAIRSILIRSLNPGEIELALEDIAHCFRINFTHDNKVVTSLNAQWLRHPLSSCPGADRQLEEMVGTPLSGDLFSLIKHADPRSHCTHMFDAMALAIVHAYQKRDDCRYDVVVPDSTSEGRRETRAELSYNGEPVMSLELRDYDFILSPEPYAGRSIFKGFLKWARVELDEKHLEYCFLLQKTAFISRAQLINLEAYVGQSAEISGPPVDSCYGSKASRFSTSVSLNTIRRLKGNPVDQVLKFIDK